MNLNSFRTCINDHENDYYKMLHKLLNKFFGKSSFTILNDIKHNLRNDSTLNDVDIYNYLSKHHKMQGDKNADYLEYRAKKAADDIVKLLNYNDIFVLPGKLLDYGAGDGSITHALANALNRKAYALEIKEWDEQIHIDPGYKNVKYVYVDNGIPDTIKDVSLILFKMALHHMRDDVIIKTVETLCKYSNKDALVVINEHDDINNCITPIINIEHGLYIYNGIKMDKKIDLVSSDDFKSYVDNYKSINDWIKMLSPYMKLIYRQPETWGITRHVYLIFKVK